ncbi:hypothetical protein V8J82_10590 [Gymnodinialimonas sp. 2305UL16-5]|uniref:hypothetical protein n=1 Tax=Gymnodinialimonas mytili TaxID=3126503 RepID=UPI0030B5BE2A
MWILETAEYWSYPMAAMLLPLACFVLGVRIAIVIKRYPNVSAKAMWWMSAPVALLIVGANMSNASIIVQGTTTFAYMQTPGQLMTAMGITILYGVLTPTLFESFLERLTPKRPEDDVATPGA